MQSTPAPSILIIQLSARPHRGLSVILLWAAEASAIVVLTMADSLNVGIFDTFSEPCHDRGYSLRSTGVSIADIRACVQTVKMEGEKRGLPVATAAFPFPQEGLRCGFCKSEFRTTMQPLIDRTSPFLEVAQKGAKVCLSCRSTHNCAQSSSVVAGHLVCQRMRCRQPC